jgi:hypothetical protein
MATKSLMQVRGIARYPYLNKPDTKFDDCGVFKVDLIITNEVGTPILSRFTKMRLSELTETQKRLKGKKAKEADLPIQPELDEGGNETGNFILRAKMKASGISKLDGSAWSRQLPLFDAGGKPTSVRIGGGSEIILAIEPKAWSNPKGECSVTCYLDAVQVLSAMSGGGGTASQFGFGVVEGGFSSSEDDQIPEDEDEDEGAGGEAADEPEYDFS